MVETSFGIRNYTCSDRTKRPSKSKIDLEKVEKRNTNQRRLYITLDNIDEIFSDNETYPVCYALIFNTIQGKVTKYFKTRSYDRKKEVSYDCMNRLYSILKRKLLKQKETVPNPTLFFYLSQFFRYIDLLVYGTVYYDTQDYKIMVQEPEDFKTEDVLNKNDYYSNDDEIYEKVQKSITEDESENSEFRLSDYYISPEDIEDDTSNKVKYCIENNEKLDNKEKNVLLKLYKKAYSPLNNNCTLTKRENEILNILQLRIEYEPDLLGDLEGILNAETTSED